MPVKPKPITRADGTVRYRVQFREHLGETPTSETFDTLDGAHRFIETADEVGWATARRVRYATTDQSHIPTLAAWFETHLTALSASVTPGTTDGYRREAARTWLPHLGRFPLDMITSDDITRWIAWQRRQETAVSARRRAAAAKGGLTPPPELVSPKTISNAQRLLSSVLAAAQDRHGTGNPAKGAALPSDAEPAEMVFLTPAEFAAVYAAIPAYWQPFVALLAGSGMRWGEVTALRRADFDLDGDVPSVRVSRAWKRAERGGTYLGGPKSRRGRRSVSLSPSTVAAIRDRVEATSPDGLVFTGVRGGKVAPQNFHPRVWHPAVAASKIRKRPRVHDLRHSHASWLIHQGVPLPVIQQRLGHESIQTTVDRYGHVMPDAAAIAAGAVERSMGLFDPALELTAEIVNDRG